MEWALWGPIPVAGAGFWKSKAIHPCSGALGCDVRWTHGLGVSEARLTCSGNAPSNSPNALGKGQELSQVVPYLARKSSHPQLGQQKI